MSTSKGGGWQPNEWVVVSGS